MSDTSTRDGAPGAVVPGRIPLRAGPVSLVWRPRTLLVPLLTLGVLFLGVLVNCGRGDIDIPVGDVAQALFGGGDEGNRMVVTELRLPRSVTGLLVGAALALAGAIVQGLARNPLASPDILGITAGSGVGAVTVIVFGGAYGGVGGSLASVGIPTAAMAGGLLAAVAVYALAVRRGLSGYRVLLVGVGVNAILTSVLSWLLLKADIVDAGRALLWLNGSLNGASWDTLRPVMWTLLVLMPVALLLSFPFGALVFDDDTARGLGVRMTATRVALLFTAVLLTAAATAAAGPIAFVALACPQLAVRLLRTGTPPLLASALIGAAVTVWADVLGRTAFGNIELPVGILTAALGAPYLLYLLIRSGRARTS
ncbi:iron chelate uptake ABC transporter family permease subunit [Streptomyces sp. SCA3-4]|uniref:FecCD family ABC transporter permease n=1 Tax=Streptomyces sichuanensis TaxID=2871810 RepID=UPI001CE2C0B5|nr:iron chelate uptake ABC transporter family permease subunit [Streptomyces sichuanensis]MCA6091292.1 iron chelate uptake ABC transporter family permease subunit [Streptomyces sichuanensis]